MALTEGSQYSRREVPPTCRQGAGNDSCHSKLEAGILARSRHERMETRGGSRCIPDPEFKRVPGSEQDFLVNLVVTGTPLETPQIHVRDAEGLGSGPGSPTTKWTHRIGNRVRWSVRQVTRHERLGHVTTSRGPEVRDHVTRCPVPDSLPK